MTAALFATYFLGSDFGAAAVFYHSRKGERIYHLPGMPYYAQTVAEEVFCTEAQARAAGYRGPARIGVSIGPAMVFGRAPELFAAELSTAVT